MKIQAALKSLRVQEKPNVAKTARDHMLKESTLRHRFNGDTVSWAQYQSEKNQKLTNIQEQVLIKNINKMTDRGIPPTSRMVKNFAEEMIGGRLKVHKNWIGDFVRRHKEVLKSVYLRNIDHLRRRAEYEPMFKQFYNLVCPIFGCEYRVFYDLHILILPHLDTTEYGGTQHYCRQSIELG